MFPISWYWFSGLLCIRLGLFLCLLIASFNSPGIKSPLNSSSFNFGRLSMPERLRTLSSVNDQMIFSSLGADPLANPMLVMAEPSTIRRLRLGNSSLLNLIWLSTQAFSFRIRQRTYRILANIFSSGRASTPERDCMPSVEHKMIFSSLWAPPSNKMSVMLEPSTRKHLRFLNS
uniref:Uncharacterized protein n=1 Tax=Triticum urartu TaxID=4572 RepID=A0A8R7RDC2_TRIUA